MTDRIVDVRVTPIAFRDPPLLNVGGVHQPWALRSIIEDTLMNIMYEIPSRPDIQKCVVGADTINKRTPPLLLTRSNTSAPVGLDGEQMAESSA